MASVTTLLSTLPLAAAGWGEGNFFLPLSVTLAGGIAGSSLFLPMFAASCASGASLEGCAALDVQNTLDVQNAPDPPVECSERKAVKKRIRKVSGIKR